MQRNGNRGFVEVLDVAKALRLSRVAIRNQTDIVHFASLAKEFEEFRLARADGEIGREHGALVPIGLLGLLLLPPPFLLFGSEYLVIFTCATTIPVSPAIAVSVSIPVAITVAVPVSAPVTVPPVSTPG